MTPSDENVRPLKFWCAGGSLLTVIESEGAKAVAFLDSDEIASLELWYESEPAPKSQDATDFFNALKRRDEWRRAAYAD